MGCAEREWVSRSGSAGAGWQGLVGSLRSVGVTQKPWAWAFDTPVFSFFLNLIPNVIVTPGFFLLWVAASCLCDLGQLLPSLLEPQFPQVRWAGQANLGSCRR